MSWCSARGSTGASNWKDATVLSTSPYGQDRLIRELCRVNPNTVVVLHAGGGINMTPWIDSCAAAIHAFYPGEEGGNALAHILSGKVNPSAKLPFTIERRWADSPAAGNYDETRREKKIYYREGIFTGYWGYEKRNIAPLFPLRLRPVVHHL